MRTHFHPITGQPCTEQEYVAACAGLRPWFEDLKPKDRQYAEGEDVPQEEGRELFTFDAECPHCKTKTRQASTRLGATLPFFQDAVICKACRRILRVSAI